MTNPFWRRAASLLAAFALTFSAVGPAAAYSTSPNEYQWHARSGGTQFRYFIPVCLGKNMGGPVWNPNDNAVEETIWMALEQWNLLGRELQYYLTNAECATLVGTIHLKFLWRDPVEGGGVAVTELISTRDGRAEMQQIAVEPENQTFCIDSFHWDVCNWTMSSQTPLSNSQGYHFLDLMTVLIHEIGHASGLEHPWPWDPCEAVMKSFDTECWPNGDYRRNLQLDDREGFRSLWPDN